MDKGFRKTWFPWLFPRQPKLRLLTLVAAASALAVIAALQALRVLVPLLDLQVDFDGSDDRPPIIISNGSLWFDGGDAVNDGATLKQNWRDWQQDLLSDHWKPALATGKNVNRYDVSVTGSASACGPLHGKIIVVEYTRTDGGTPAAPTFTLNTHPWGGFGRIEPKLEPNGLALDVTPVARDANGAPTAPSRLTFQAQGYISKLTVSQSPGSTGDTCTFTQGDKPRITVVQFNK